MKFLNVCVFAALAGFFNVAHAEKHQLEGREIEVKMEPEKSPILLGEPGSLNFIVENHSPDDLQVIVGGDYRNTLGRPGSFKVETRDEKGELVPQPDAGMNFGGMFGPRKLPAHGNFVVHLFLPDWATFSRPGRYRITASRTLPIGRAGGDFAAWDKDPTIKSSATTEFEVLPADAQKMGLIIDELGQKLLADNRKGSTEARVKLDAIHDPRVIPYFVKAFEKTDYNTRFDTLVALARFNDDAALKVLVRGVSLPMSEDIGNNLRLAAAYGLAQSPHPKALDLLLAAQNSPAMGVRLVALQIFNEKKRPEGLVLARKMLGDKDEGIRGEAERYLKESQQQAKK